MFLGNLANNISFYAVVFYLFLEESLKTLLRFLVCGGFEALCPNLPTGMVERVTAFLSALPDNRVTERANAMLDGLDDLLRHTRFL